MADSIPPIVDELAVIFAQHRVIPFLGAGCSVGHVRVDWDALRDEMANAIGSSELDHLKVAGAYVRARGRADLEKLLVERLHVGDFDPTCGEVQLRVMGLNVPVMYTTNQDPLVELCYAKHGRRLSVAIDINDIATISPREPVLYKFHGDCTRPESIVFTDEDYAKRLPPSDHPLDIRLRSDALARTFVFFGYSFRDPNVQALFSQLQAVFRGKLPPSYLIQFTPDANFAARMSSEYGVRAVSCRDAYPDAGSDEVAFFQFFRDLSKAVIYKKTAEQLEERFKPKVPPSFSVATPIDVEGVAHAVAGDDVERSIRAFRGAYDQAVIAAGLQPHVSAQFVELCRQAADDRHVVELRGALFNLRFTEVGPSFEAMCAVYALANVSASKSGMFETFMPHLPGFDTDTGAARLVVIASTFLLLEAWGRLPTKRFYEWVAFMLHDPPARSALPADVRQHVDGVFSRFYGSGRTTFEQPLDRADRLAKLPGRLATGTDGSFERIRSGLMATMAKVSGRPYQQ